MPDIIHNIYNRFTARGIFFRTFATLMGLAIILITLFALMAIPGGKAALLKTMESQAKSIATSISEATALSSLNGDYGAVVEHNANILLKSRDVKYIVAVRHDGFSIVNIPGRWETREKPDPAWQGRELSQSGGVIFSSLVGKDIYHYCMPMNLSGFKWGYLYIGISLDNYEEQLRNTYTGILYLSLLCLLIAAGLSYLFARRLAQPIRKLNYTARQIMQGDMTARADVPQDKEVGELAVSFNKMADQMIASRNNIQNAYDELEVYRKDLERLVQQRTAELTAANLHLQQELAERVRAENALIESERRYRVIFETAGNANMIVEEDGTLSMINSAFENISGDNKGDVEGKKVWLDYFVSADHEELEHLKVQCEEATEGYLADYETTFMDKKGTEHFVYVTIACIPGTGQIIISLVDLTDVKKLENQLLQAQKMEAIGKLAGGVAHDFNNILGAITGYASLLKMNIEQENILTDYINPILSSAERAAQLTQGLLAFSRKQIIAPKHVDVNEIISKLGQLLGRLLNEDIELRISCGKEPIIISADRGQIDQILMNLSTNARDALPAGGIISITTETIDFRTDKIDIHNPDQIEPGKYAVISVSDNGSGMRKENIEHIFEPFFTTKEVGKGTGLGLSIVYGIIKQHNGYIKVYSEPGVGTTFRIYLPLVKEIAEEESPQLPAPEGGSETILVAEDDDSIRRLSRLVLEKFGYIVIEAVDGEDAVEKFKQHHDHIDLVLIDVIMPKLNGKAAYDAMNTINPKTKALFMSGYTADIIHKKGIIESNINFISKPVTPQIMVRKIREVLDAD